MYYACINNNTVENVIIAEPDFIESWNHNYELVVPCQPHVGIGIKYDETTGFALEKVTEEEIVDVEEVVTTKQISAPKTVK